jgi:prevent-host-death family protein
MATVTTRVLKDKLSAYLDRAAAGERVVVLRAGTPVAALVPVGDPAAAGEPAILADLSRRGRIQLPERARPRRRFTPVSIAEGPSASDLVSEDRR